MSAARAVQQLLALSVDRGVQADGIVGPQTLSALASAPDFVVRTAQVVARNHNSTLEEVKNSASTGNAGWEKDLTARALRAGINPASVDALIHQVRIESSGNFRVSEKMHTEKQNAWLRREVRNFRNYTDKDFAALRALGPEAYFNTMYANRSDLDNGPVASGDGFKYRGRGPLQITGKDNYRRVGKIVGHDLVADPDWVIASDDNGVAAAIAFLESKKRLKTPLTIAQMSKLVNPNLKGA